MLRWCQPLVTYGVAMSIRFERRPAGGERLRIIAGITVGSFLAGLGVAPVAAIVAFNTHQCAPDLSDDECGTFLLGFGVFLVTLAITPVIAMPVLAWLTQMGAVFTTAATVAMALIGFGTYGFYLGHALLLYPLGVAVLVAAALLANREPALSSATPTKARSTRKWVVAVAVAVVVVSAIPLGRELNQVRSEQQGIEAVIREPLQTDLDGTWPYSVDYSSTGIEYAVLEPAEPNGDRIANVDVTVRRLDTEPCSGFTDVTESARCLRADVSGCGLQGAGGNLTRTSFVSTSGWGGSPGGDATPSL